MSTELSNYLDKCIGCESKGIVRMPRYAKDFLCQCSQCGLIFSQLIPTIDELDKVYSKYSRANSISSITIKRYEELLEEFEKYRKTGKILDVGAGDGHFLEVAKMAGWDVYGTEYDDRAIALCKQKGIKTFQGKLSLNDYEENFFDVVTSFEVIEHINNPNEDLGIINKILRKGGVLYITTPNFNGISRRYQRERWTELCYPEHLTYYSAKTLSNLVNAHGFRTLRNLTTGIAINRKYDGQIAGGSVQEQSIREISESSFFIRFAKDSVNYILNVFKIGDALKALYIKE
jgi:2-polyprenyl-3-methyl-5-hydroxy-6-metoxy-1,4-benzoquinol methylase